jgi:hypothetical protein
MPTTYQTSGVITDVGIAAAIAAGVTGPQINLGGYRIGSDSAMQGAVALTTDVDVDSLVYSGPVSNITYTIIDADTINWKIRLDTTVGNFEIGNVGIILEDGTLFCKAVLPGQSYKWISNPPTTVGNIKYLNIIMHLANAQGLINLTIMESDTASLPEVATELVLPEASSTPYNAWMVDNHTHGGIPTTALRLNGKWWHATHRENPGQGQGVLVSSADKFSTVDTVLDGIGVVYAAPAVGPVGFDQDLNKFVAADPVRVQSRVIGVRTSTFEVMTLGIIPGASIGIIGTLVPGTPYYADTGVNAGKFSTTINGDAIAFAVSATDVWVDTTSLLISMFSSTVLDDLFVNMLAAIAGNSSELSKLRAQMVDVNNKTNLLYRAVGRVTNDRY